LSIVPGGSNLPNKAQIHAALLIISQFIMVGLLETPSPPPLPANSQNTGQNHTHPARDILPCVYFPRVDVQYPKESRRMAAVIHPLDWRWGIFRRIVILLYRNKTMQGSHGVYDF
jgi:hypothetical protein